MQRRGQLVFAVLGALVFVSLALAWSFSPLREYLNLSMVVGRLRNFAQGEEFLTLSLGFALALILVVPLMFLSVVTVVALGPFKGFLCVMIGAQIAAAVSFGIGLLLGRNVLRMMGGARINRLSAKLGDKGFLAILVARLVPIAPFAVINMFAGATHIRLFDLLLGTFLGMAPGTLFISFFTDKIVSSIQ